MNNPLASSFGDFRIRSLKNRERDEMDLVDLRGQSKIMPGNSCVFPTKIFVINVSEREDRWTKFQDNNRQLLAEFSFHRWEASVVNLQIHDVVDAIFDSFSRCMAFGLEEDETIVIMEDDVYLAEGGLEKLKLAWKDLPSDWDILIGNHYFFGQLEILTDHLAKPIGRASTANFSIVRRTILPKLEFHLPLRDQHPSERDVDHYFTSKMTSIQNYTVWPMISREIPSFSDHKQKNLDSAIKIRENAFKYKFVDGDKYYSSLEGW